MLRACSGNVSLAQSSQEDWMRKHVWIVVVAFLMAFAALMPQATQAQPVAAKRTPIETREVKGSFGYANFELLNGSTSFRLYVSSGQQLVTRNGVKSTVCYTYVDLYRTTEWYTNLSAWLSTNECSVVVNKTLTAGQIKLSGMITNQVNQIAMPFTLEVNFVDVGNPKERYMSRGDSWYGAMNYRSRYNGDARDMDAILSFSLNGDQVNMDLNSATVGSSRSTDKTSVIEIR